MTAPQVVLEVDGDAGPLTVPALLIPRDYIVVSELSADRLGDVAAGEVVISPPDGSELPQQRIGTAGMRVFPVVATGRVVVAIKLALSVATVSISITGDEFHGLVAENNQDVVSALRSSNITTELLRPPFQPPVGHEPGRPQPPFGWTPLVPPWGGAEFGFCCFCRFCDCPDDHS